ncbi:MAG TPA: triose-phosphate isomerase [Desulfobacteraceae bacterium]|nr:triose-phosphate isomerase [Desulfobacteraceae bacterium]
MSRRPLIAGNWKMNLSLSEAEELVHSIGKKAQTLDDRDTLIAPPFILIAALSPLAEKYGIILAGQNMHWEDRGAYTGEVSGKMLKEAGCTHVIIGHSERRNIFREDDNMINQKTKKALEIGLTPILCIGEKLNEREKNRTIEVIGSQLEKDLNGVDLNANGIIIAYEPVWAIGTGKTATPSQAQEVHEFIRDFLKNSYSQEISEETLILYGGSVRPENISQLMAQPDIDGVLVGGASLKAETFIPIMEYGC